MAGEQGKENKNGQDLGKTRKLNKVKRNDRVGVPGGVCGDGRTLSQCKEVPTEARASETGEKRDICDVVSGTIISNKQSCISNVDDVLNVEGIRAWGM